MHRGSRPVRRAARTRRKRRRVRLRMDHARGTRPPHVADTQTGTRTPDGSSGPHIRGARARPAARDLPDEKFAHGVRARLAAGSSRSARSRGARFLRRHAVASRTPARFLLEARAADQGRYRRIVADAGPSDAISANPRRRPGTMGAVSDERLPGRARKRRVGRVEAGLERELVERHDVGAAERSALRAQARAVDVGEAAGDSDAVTRANAVYLDLRMKAGLTSNGRTANADPIDALLAELSRPGAGASDLPNT